MAKNLKYFCDDWPSMADGGQYNGTQMLGLLRINKSPFRGIWDVNLLIKETEDVLKASVVHIPFVYHGDSNYAFHFKMSDGRDIMARLGRTDINMPNYAGPPRDRRFTEVEFEAAVYKLLESEPSIMIPKLLHYRVPVWRHDAKLSRPLDIMGRCLMVFERAEGEGNIWWDLEPEQHDALLSQLSHVRAALFHYQLPLDFAATWFYERIFKYKPTSLTIPVVPTREFCTALLTSAVEETIGNIGDKIGLETDNLTVGPIAAAAKQSLLRLIPHIMPRGGDQASLYRLVLEHGDFGHYNMSVAINENGQPTLTSLWDWESGYIVPAIFSDPSTTTGVELVVGENATPRVDLLPDNPTRDERREFAFWSREYFKPLFSMAPDYKATILAGEQARHVWFKLRKWIRTLLESTLRESTSPGQGVIDPEEYFGELGVWAEKEMKKIGVSVDSEGDAMMMG